MDNKTPQQRRAERQKYLQIQRGLRAAGILLAIVLSIAALAQSCSTKKAIADLAAQLREKKIAEAQAELQAMSPDNADTEAATAEGPTLTLSFAGGITFGDDESTAYEGSFAQCYAEKGDSYFFQNVKSLFEGDDLTVASFEGTLSVAGSRQEQDTAFRADPSYGTLLSDAGIDTVTVANDHTHDYGDESYVDTLANLDNAKVGRFGYENLLKVPVRLSGPNGTENVTLGFTGVWLKDGLNARAVAYENVEKLKDEGVDLIIVCVRWDSEQSEAPDSAQVEMAHSLIDAGADLILGEQPGVIQGIEVYGGKYIVYSLGSLLSASGEDTVIFQQTFTLSEGKFLKYADYNLIPCTTKDFCPTPVEGSAAAEILGTVYDRSAMIDGGILDERTPEETPADEASDQETPAQVSP